MKKLLILAFLLILTGCNKKIFEFDYSFETIICDYNGNKFELKINEWTDYDGEQLQIETDDKIYLVSANHCYMVHEKSDE